MLQLSERNQYRKVAIEDIVFLQGDDYEQYSNEKEQSESWSDINYLLQWYYPNEHEQGEYRAEDINTPFLGRLIKIDGYKGYFLFSKNTRIGYIGLARIVGFPK